MEDHLVWENQYGDMGILCGPEQGVHHLLQLPPLLIAASLEYSHLCIRSCVALDKKKNIQKNFHFVNCRHHQLLGLLLLLQFFAVTNTQTDKNPTKQVPRFQIHRAVNLDGKVSGILGGSPLWPMCGLLVLERWQVRSTWAPNCVHPTRATNKGKSGPLNPLWSPLPPGLGTVTSHDWYFNPIRIAIRVCKGSAG